MTFIKGDILELGIDIFGLIGEKINYTSKRIFAYRILNTIVFILILVFVLANCYKVSGIMLVKTLEDAITVIHILTKYIAFMYGKTEIGIIIKDTLKFWRPENVSAKLATDASRMFGYVKIMQKIILLIILTSVHFHFLKPYFNSRDIFPLHSWIIYDSFFLYLVILFLQYYCLCICTAVVLSYDIIYCSMCVHVITQLRLLKYKISNIATDTPKELRICIKHHQLLSSVFARMQRIYSWVLLLQYFMTLGMACVQLYILNTGKLEIADTVELVLYLATMYGEFGYYSVPVEEISFQFADVANSIYMSFWYQKDVTTKRTLLTTMTCAQSPKYLIAGSIVRININTFGSVFRKSFSLYLVLKNLIK